MRKMIKIGLMVMMIGSISNNNVTTNARNSVGGDTFTNRRNKTKIKKGNRNETNNKRHRLEKYRR